jgi:hypothetical protein
MVDGLRYRSSDRWVSARRSRVIGARASSLDRAESAKIFVGYRLGADEAGLTRIGVGLGAAGVVGRPVEVRDGILRCGLRGVIAQNDSSSRVVAK